MRVVVRFVLSALLLTFLFVPLTQAQYFGRNKVQWEQFDFKVLQTEHFDIYYYETEADVVEDIARMSERWYARLSRVFNHSFRKKPIVLYANSADFHQTTTTGGQIVTVGVLVVGIGFVALLTAGFAQRFLAPEIAEIEQDLGQGEISPEALALRELRSVQEQLQALQVAVETMAGEKEDAGRGGGGPV